jgi:hypothetical protein
MIQINAAFSSIETYWTNIFDFADDAEGFQASAQTALDNASSILISSDGADLEALQSLLIEINTQSQAASSAVASAEAALKDAEDLRDGDLTSAISTLSTTSAFVNDEFSTVQSSFGLFG